jgi:hypothetical protein
MGGRLFFDEFFSTYDRGMGVFISSERFYASFPISHFTILRKAQSMDPIIIHTARVIIGFILITAGVAYMGMSWRHATGTPLGTGVGAALTVLGIKAMFA